MNIKKLFATLAGVSLFAQSVIVAPAAFAANYGEELEGAYKWAYENGITTMPTIDDANMLAPITRAEMAKMLANWAMNVKGKTPDTSRSCTFTDTASVKGDLAQAIIDACQLGLMGQGITAFRPYDTITRAEFGTALSRALWGTTYEGGNPYYANHLNALKAAGIMNQIANAESMKEVRGYVMLMLQRSEEGTSKVDCDDAAIALACELDSDKCPAECKKDASDEKEDTIVKSGDLAVSATANKGASVITNGATSELDTLTFKASEDITLKSVTLERYGYSKATDVASIWLEDLDGNKVTAEKSLSASKDTVTLTLKKDYQNIENGDELVVVMTTPTPSTAAGLGSTSIGFKVKEVESSAKNLDLSKYDANLYDIIDYAGSDAKVQLKGSNKTYNYEEGKSYEVAKLKVSATNSAILVKGFTLTQAAGMDLDLDKFVDEVEVLVDGKKISSKASLKRDELTVSFDEQEIAINKNSTFTVNVTLKDFDDFGALVSLGFDEPSDVTVLEAKNKVRVSVKDSTGTAFTTMYGGPVYTFMGGKINLTNVKLSSSIDAAEGSDDVVIAEGKIALGGQAVRLPQLKLEPNDLGTVTAGKSPTVEAIRFIVDDEEYEFTANNNWTVRNVVIEEDSKLKVTVDILDTVLAGATNFAVTVNGTATSAFNKTTLATIEYDDVNAGVAGTAAANLVGSISISSVKIQPAKGSLNNDSTKKVEFKVKETTDKTVFKGTYTAKKNGNVNLDNVKIWLSNTSAPSNTIYDDYVNLGTDLSDSSDVTFTVKIDGEDVATIDNPKYALNATAATVGDADFSPIAVEAEKSVSVEIIATIYADHETKANLEYKVQLSGKDDSGNDAGNATKDLAPIAFVDNTSINVSSNASMKKQDVVLANKNQTLATFIVKPANKSSSANLDSLELVLDANLDALATAAGLVAGTNEEDYFEVKIGGKDGTIADNLSYDGTSRLTVSDINMDIEGETEVSVIFKEKLTVIDSDGNATNGNQVDDTTANAYVLTLDKVNGGTSLGTTYQYKRVAVNSLVRVESMKGSREDETKYVFDIDYADDVNSEKIDNIKFTYDSDLVAGWDPAGAAAGARQNKVWTNVEAGKTYSVDNDTKANYVNTITYLDGDGDTVILTIAGSEDFFKTNGTNEDKLRAYANGN